MDTYIAPAIASGVRVVRLGIDTAVLDNVGKRIVHQPTVAALVALGRGAVHQLLLRERHERMAGNLPGTFNGARGGERPAAAALCIITHGTI